MSHEVLRGALGTHKKKGIEERFFVLYEDAHLDYYTCEADLSSGAAPRGQINLAEVSSLDVTEQDIVLHLDNGAQFSVRPPSAATLRDWAACLRGLSGPGRGAAPQEAAPASPAHDEVLCQGPLTVKRGGGFMVKYFVLKANAIMYYRQQADWENGMDPRGVCALGDVVGMGDCDGGGFVLRLTKPLNPLVLHAPNEQDLKKWVREIAALLVPQVGVAAIEHKMLIDSAKLGQETDPQAPLHKGKLNHVKNKKTELKYFVLLYNHMEYFNTADELERGITPRGQVALSDVQDVLVQDNCITVDLGARKFVLEVLGAPPEAEAARWGRAWEQALLAAPLGSVHPDARVRWEMSVDPAKLEAAPARPAVAASHAPVVVADPPREKASAARSPAVRNAKQEDARPQDPVEAAAGAIQSLLQRKNLRAANLFQVTSRYKPVPSKDGSHLLLDERGLKALLSDADLELSPEDSAKVLEAFDSGGKGGVDVADLEAALRKHHRTRAHDEEEGRRRRRTTMSSAAMAQAVVRLPPQAEELAARARLRLRSAGYGGRGGAGGASWARVFEHYARKDGGGIDLPGFISMVRRDVKISYHEMPDATLEQVFAAVSHSSNSIGYTEFIKWLGVREAAEHEQQEEVAAVKMQALFRGAKGRRRAKEARARGPQILRRGKCVVELKDGSSEKWTVILYEDRMECVSGQGGHRILGADIEDVDLDNQRFIINVRGGVRLTIQCPEGTHEEWMDSFCRLCGEQRACQARPAVGAADWEDDMPWSSEDDEPSASMASMASTAASAGYLLPPPGHSGPKSLGGRSARGALGGLGAALGGKRAGEVPTRIGRAEILELLRGRPHLAGFLGLPPCTRKDLDGALARLDADGRQELSLGELAAIFSGAGDPSKLEKGSKSPGRARGCMCATPLKPRAVPEESACEEAWSVSPDLLAGFPDGQVQTWLASLKEPPLHAGLLGFKGGAKVVMRCSLLFKDRLDTWDTASLAMGGHLPRDRILLRDVHSIEIIRGGFVLNSKGRKVRLHLPPGSDARAWSGALHSLLPVHNETAGGTPRQRSASQRRSRSPSSKVFVPRVASLAPSPRPRSREPRKTMGVVTSQGHEAQRDGIRINTHSSGVQAGRLLHGADALVRPSYGGTVSGKINERAGSLATARPEVVGKVTDSWRLPLQRSPLQRSPGSSPVAAKVTGDRTRSLTPRPARGQSISAKITGEVPRSTTPERCASFLPAKVTGPAREALSTPRARSMSPVAAKITDVGREATGRARPVASVLDRMRPFGAPLSGAHGGGQLMTARILF